jgi:hypothetical protein
MSADSVSGSPSNPQSLNLYAYVMNNPTKYSDPSGHQAQSQSQGQQTQQQLPPSIAGFTLNLSITIPVIVTNATERLFNQTLDPVSVQVEIIQLSQVQGAVNEWLQSALPAYYQAELQNQKDDTLGRDEVTEKQDKSSETVGGEVSNQGKGGITLGTAITGAIESTMGLKGNLSKTGEQMDKTTVHNSRTANEALIDTLVPANDKLYQGLGAIQIDAPDGHGGHIRRGLLDREKLQALESVNQMTSAHVHKVVSRNISSINVPQKVKP